MTKHWLEHTSWIVSSYSTALGIPLIFIERFVEGSLACVIFFYFLLASLTNLVLLFALLLTIILEMDDWLIRLKAITSTALFIPTTLLY